MSGPAEPAAGAASGVSGPAAGGVSESDVEDAALGWLAGLGWTIAHGPDVASDAPGAERGGYGEVVLGGRLRAALARLNPGLPDEALRRRPPQAHPPGRDDLGDP